jgi:hypothetical protein
MAGALRRVLESALEPARRHGVKFRPALTPPSFRHGGREVGSNARQSVPCKRQRPGPGSQIRSGRRGRWSLRSFGSSMANTQRHREPHRLANICQRTGGSRRLGECQLASGTTHIAWWWGSWCSYMAGVGGSSPSAPTEPQVRAHRAGLTWGGVASAKRNYRGSRRCP